jgi:hypothetical protein
LTACRTATVNRHAASTPSTASTDLLINNSDVALDDPILDEIVLDKKLIAGIAGLVAYSVVGRPGSNAEDGRPCPKQIAVLAFNYHVYFVQPDIVQNVEWVDAGES